MMTIKAWQNFRNILKTWPENKHYRVAVALIRQLFITLLITYLILLLAETIFPESVSGFLNLNYLLIAVIIPGIITVITLNKSGLDMEQGPVTRNTMITFIVMGLAGAVLIWYRTQEIGWLSYIVSLASGGLIVLLSRLIWEKGGKGESEGEDSQDN